MRYFSFVDEKTDDATLSLVYHNLPNDKIKVYSSSDVKVCSVDADDALIAEWLGAQVVEMIEITIAEFQTKRAESEQWACEWAWLKKMRVKETEEIKVTTTTGKTFDGDEVAQGRISRAILGMSDTDTVFWKLANNSISQVTRAELQEALRLAGAAQAMIWNKYQ